MANVQKKETAAIPYEPAKIEEPLKAPALWSTAAADPAHLVDVQGYSFKPDDSKVFRDSEIEMAGRVIYHLGKKEKTWNEKPRMNIRRNYWTFFTSTSMVRSTGARFSKARHALRSAA
jgi:hypothetical protein